MNRFFLPTLRNPTTEFASTKRNTECSGWLRTLATVVIGCLRPWTKNRILGFIWLGKRWGNWRRKSANILFLSLSSSGGLPHSVQDLHDPLLREAQALARGCCRNAVLRQHVLSNDGYFLTKYVAKVEIELHSSVLLFSKIFSHFDIYFHGSWIASSALLLVLNPSCYDCWLQQFRESESDCLSRQEGQPLESAKTILSSDFMTYLVGFVIFDNKTSGFNDEPWNFWRIWRHNFRG